METVAELTWLGNQGPRTWSRSDQRRARVGPETPGLTFLSGVPVPTGRRGAHWHRGESAWPLPAGLCPLLSWVSPCSSPFCLSPLLQLQTPGPGKPRLSASLLLYLNKHLFL